ncbi:MAG: M48 family metallopeptidase [Chitinophagaceae bacterium]|nr:M48 family metallopeptidase [Chitinophagaceae bacterium]
MKRNKITLLLIIALLSQSCHTVPVTGRKSMSWIPEGTMQSMALSQYQGFLQQNPPIGGADADMVKRVGSRLKAAVIKYCQDNKLKGSLTGYSWDFNLVKSPELNAWCMPGCKVVVYSGLLPVTANEAGLAAVLGHEISHALARHGSERMTQGLIAQGIAITADIATQNNPQVNNIFNQSIGIGSTLGLLAYSRSHETEADKMGMIFMAMAGYNPSEAIEVWKRMQAKSGPKPPELFSTHPSDATRIANLQKELPSAMKYYKPQ